MSNNKTNRWLVAVAAASLMACAALDATAQATRTWVSGVGDDANPCSRTAPCKTFAGAISKTATGGEIDALDPGGYGTVTITKSITIDGAGTDASILATGTNGIIVNGAGAVVVLRNLSINGTGGSGGAPSLGINGVRFLSGSSLTMQNVIVMNFAQEAVRFAPSANASLVIDNSILRGANFGLRVQPNAGVNANVLVQNTTIEGNAAGGVRVDDGTSVLVRNSIMHGNGTVGFNAVSSGGGTVDAAIERSVSSNNMANGFVAQVPGGGGSVTLYITDSASLQNGGDGVFASGAVIRLANSRIWGNSGTGINAAAGQILSAGNNVNQANGVAGGPSGNFALQ